MYNDYDSESSFSRQDENYIKKHIHPVQRGTSAIFGDPLSYQKNQIDLPSQENSQEYEEQQGKNRSKLNFDQNKSKLDESEKSKQEEPKSLLMNEQIMKAKSEIVEKEPSVEQQARDNRPPLVQSEEISPQYGNKSNQSSKNLEQKRPRQVGNNEEQPGAQEKEQIKVQNGIIFAQQQQILQQSKIDADKLGPIKWLPQKQVKPQRIDSLQLNEDQTSLILQNFKKNTQGIERVYNYILDQNTILSQFKQDASRKLQENIKVTLKEKMNQINRQNSKEIKDIKNLVSNVVGLLEKHESRIDKIEKSTEEILKLLKKK